MPSISRTSAIALLAAAAACQTSTAVRPASPAPPPSGPIELTVASYPSFDESVKAALPLWNARHPDIKINLVSRSYGDHHKEMIQALAAGAEVPDVVAVELGWLGRLWETNRLEDLGAPPYGARPLLSRLLPFAVAQGTVDSQVPVIPADVGPGTLFYRKDVLDRAGVTEAQLTGSWEGFLEAGRKIKAATGAHLLAQAAEIKDIVIRADLAPGGRIFFDAQGQPVVQSPRFERAFELARAARRAGLDARVGTWSNEWADGLKRGTIATQPIGAWLAWHMEAWLAPESRSQWRAAQLPGGAFASWGGSFYAIPTAAAHKQAAWEFVRFMCFEREAQHLAFATLDAWPALRAAQDDPHVDEPVAYLGGQQARRLWQTSAASIPAITVTRFDTIAAFIVNDELEQVLEKDKDIRQALVDADAQIRRRIRR